MAYNIEIMEPRLTGSVYPFQRKNTPKVMESKGKTDNFNALSHRSIRGISDGMSGNIMSPKSTDVVKVKKQQVYTLSI